MRSWAIALTAYLLILFGARAQWLFYGESAIGPYFMVQSGILFVFFAPFMWQSKSVLVVCATLISLLAIYSIIVPNNSAWIPIHNVFGLFLWPSRRPAFLDLLIFNGYALIYLAYPFLLWFMSYRRSRRLAVVRA